MLTDKGNKMVNWPGILIHSGDAELVYVGDQAEWDNDAELHAFEYDESDCLVDASGKIFSLIARENNIVKPSSSGVSMELQEILGLIKAHAAQKGSCCVAKLYAPTIVDAFKMVQSLDEA